MSIKVEQAWESIDLELVNGSGNNADSTASVVFIVTGTTDDAEACMAAFNNSPEKVSGIPRRSVSISERLTERQWKITVNYERSSSGGSGSSDEQEDEETIEFSCGGGSAHITRAYSQKRWKGEGKNEAGLFIGWNGKKGDKAQIAGVDVPQGNITKTYVKKMRMRDITTAFEMKLCNMVGCINSDTFKGYPRGCALFMGASFTGTNNSEDIITVKFDFQMRPRELIEREGVSFTKNGFEYVWSIPDQKKRTDSIGLEESQIYCARVHPYANFATLGL